MRECVNARIDLTTENTEAQRIEIMTVEFKFSVGQKVKVIDIGMLGHVDALLFENNTTLYRVIYWNDGIRYQTFMYEYEIEGVK